MNPIRIALVDDHALFRYGLKKLLDEDAEMEVRLEAGSGQELLEKMSRQKVDLVLTDIEMPEPNGLELTRMICRDYKSVKVVGLSMHSQIFYVKKMLEYGAHGYMNKTIEPKDLIACLKKVMSGELGFCSKSADLLMKSALDKGKSEQAFSERDMHLVRMLFEEKSTEEISIALGISARREQMLVQELMEKVGVKTRIGLVKWVYAHGLA